MKRRQWGCHGLRVAQPRSPHRPHAQSSIAWHSECWGALETKRPPASRQPRAPTPRQPCCCASKAGQPAPRHRRPRRRCDEPATGRLRPHASLTGAHGPGFRCLGASAAVRHTAVNSQLCCRASRRTRQCPSSRSRGRNPMATRQLGCRALAMESRCPHSQRPGRSLTSTGQLGFRAPLAELQRSNSPRSGPEPLLGRRRHQRSLGLWPAPGKRPVAALPDAPPPQSCAGDASRQLAREHRLEAAFSLARPRSRPGEACPRAAVTADWWRGSWHAPASTRQDAPH